MKENHTKLEALYASVREKERYLEDIASCPSDEAEASYEVVAKQVKDLKTQIKTLLESTGNQ